MMTSNSSILSIHDIVVSNTEGVVKQPAEEQVTMGDLPLQFYF
jgi:hypothetical protein